MVRRWLDAGRPRHPTPGRFEKFSNTVGSILAANGLPGFLSNARTEIRDHSTTHRQLVAIAERLIDSGDERFVWRFEGDLATADDDFKRGSRPASPREQKDWMPHLTSVGVLSAACPTPEQQKAAATRYLNSVVKVFVEVDIGDQSVQAVIVSRPLGKRRVAYMLAVKGLPAVLDTAAAIGERREEAPAPSAPSGEPAAEVSSACPGTASCRGGGPATGTVMEGGVDGTDGPDDLWGLGQG